MNAIITFKACNVIKELRVYSMQKAKSIQVPTKNHAAVYFLMLDTQIVYVGCTASSLRGRLKKHYINYTFDLVWYLEYPKVLAKQSEIFWIKTFNPMHNKRYG